MKFNDDSRVKISTILHLIRAIRIREQYWLILESIVL
jgi:hypothetical protein